jgi:hypothetical protein
MQRPLDVLAPGLFKSRIYWTYGSAPRDMAASDVDDPPTSGWSTVMIMDDPDPKKWQLFCPYSFRGYRVRKDSYEALSFAGTGGSDGHSAASNFRDVGQKYFRESLPQKWAEHVRFATTNADWKTAEKVFKLLDIKPPTEEEINRKGRAVMRPTSAPSATSASKKPAGKPATPAAAFKPVKREGRKGEVLKAILDGTSSADALTSQFEITRSNLLSQLFLLRKNHGIGYSVSGDQIALEMPEGIADPFVG